MRLRRAGTQGPSGPTARNRLQTDSEYGYDVDGFVWTACLLHMDPDMRALLTILSGLAGAVVGWIAAAVLTLALGAYFGLTEFEGQRSMTAFFGIGPIGGVIGLIAGLWLALQMRRA